MYFIAFVDVRETPYMNDTKRYKRTHLVEADDECEAQKKVEKFYSDKDDAYGVHYRVDVEIGETIT